MQQTVVLTDVAESVRHDSFLLNRHDGPDMSGSEDWSFRQVRLRGGRSDGVDVIHVDNGRLSMSLLPTRGMGLWRGACDGLPLGWSSPVEQPVNPAFVDLNDRNGLGWLTGFNELLCRCGLGWNGPPGDDNGRFLTLHGRIANQPAHRVAIDADDTGPGVLRVHGQVDETMMFDSRFRMDSTFETEVGSNGFRIRDVVTNRGGQTAEFQLLYHINVGAPFLGAGSRVLAAFDELMPRDARAAEGTDQWDEYAASAAGYAEQVYYLRPVADSSGRATALLHNSAADNGFVLSWNLQQLPCFSLWKNTQHEADGACTGLEPGTNYPNFRGFEREQGRVVNLEPGQSYETDLEIRILTTADEVSESVESLVKTDSPTLHASPAAPWAPSA